MYTESNVVQISPGLPVIAIDTGFLPPETYRYMEELKERLDLNLIVVNNSEWSAARIEALHGKLWEQDDEQRRKKDYAMSTDVYFFLLPRNENETKHHIASHNINDKIRSP